MIPPAHVAALRILHERLAETDVVWAVTGSLGLALQGVPVEPHDVDVQTDEAGAYAIERRFAGHVTRPVAFSSTERIRSYVGVLRIEGVDVEVMGAVQKRLPGGDWEPPVDVRDHRVSVEVEGPRVRVLSLEYEYREYLELGRIDRAQTLRLWLDRRRLIAPEILVEIEAEAMIG